MPAADRPFTMRSAPCLVRENTSARSRPFMAEHLDQQVRLAGAVGEEHLLGDLVGGLGDRVTATRTGSVSSASASFSISRGMVAEKNRLRRLAGSLATMERMAWMKPMSSIWSASSSTNTSTWSRRTAPFSIRSTRRPGWPPARRCHRRSSGPAGQAARRQWRARSRGAHACRTERKLSRSGRELAVRAQHQRAAGAALGAAALGDQMLRIGSAKATVCRCRSGAMPRGHGRREPAERPGPGSAWGWSGSLPRGPFRIGSARPSSEKVVK